MIVRLQLQKPKALGPVPWVVSALVHGVAAFFLLLWHAGPVRRTPSAYDQLIKGKEAQIVFYQFKDKLPDVKPVKAADSRPPKALEKIAKQQIVSSPKDAPKALQMVWQPVPDLLPKDVPSPNLVALQVPKVAAPERKKFVPPGVEQPKRAVRDLPQTKAMDAPAPVVAKLKPSPLENLGAMALKAENLPRFHVPELRASNKPLPATPAMGAPPAVGGAAAAAAQNALSELRNSQLNIAVVGLKPAETAALPAGSRPAEFSAGPKINPNGGTGGDKGGLSVPDLFVKGGGAEAKPTLMARLNVAPTSAENLRGLAKYATSSGGAEPSRSPARRVSNAPTSRFDGREVYTMAIQMPNITSYSGSWLMWYAGHALESGGPISPPVPHRKVDPKYIATAAEERIEGRVQLICVIRVTGKVDSVELLRGIDDRLNQSAMEALGKWEFTPATRGGQPVDVDVMVEIPFKLAPKVRVP